MKAKQLHAYFFVALLIVSLYLFGMLLMPYITVIAITVALAVLSYPLYQLILRRLKIKGLSSFLALIIVAFIILIPISFFGRILIVEAWSLFTDLQNGGFGALTNVVSSIEGTIQNLFPRFEFNFEKLGEQATRWLSGNIPSFFTSATHAFAGIVIGLILFYYLLKDGVHFKEEIIEKSPIGKVNTARVLDKLTITIHSIIRGNFLMALAQGVATGIGFALFGIPSAVLWAAIATIFALIPVLGTTFIIIGGIIYVYLTSSLLMTIGITLWGILVIAFIDDILRPYVIGRGANIHPILVLLSVIGGVAVYGPIGLILGPIVLTLFIAMFEIYPSVVENLSSRSTKKS